MSGGGNRGPRSRFAFKVLCPEPLVSSIMGSRGATKDQIQDETGAKLIVSNREEHYPGTRLRVLIIHCDEIQGILAALDRVIDRVAECGEQERVNPAPHFVGSDPEFLGKEPGEYILRTLIPSKASGAIIGRQGANIAAIRDEHNAKVFIEKNNVQGHQLLKMIATGDNLKAAIVRINDCVQEESRAENFQEWAQTRTFDGAALAHGGDDGGAGGGGGGGKTGGGGSRGGGKGGRDREPRREERDHHRGGGRRSRSRRRRSRSHDRPRDNHRGGDHRGDHRGQRDHKPAAMLQGLAASAAEFPQGSLDIEYTITCDLPRGKVSALIGKSGDHIKAVRRITNTQVHFDEAGGPRSEQQTMIIRGPLISIYRAHALMMRRYHEDEIEMQERNAPRPDVGQLQEQLAELQQQLEAARGGGGGGKHSGKGKGKGRR